ncbi:MAG TPA: TRAP transporter small permease [Stellaceae bacterium]|jgi:TRAP-type C4-dicarboxylate transport system permease small subunit|nr:TRAP transporter small permease [Stellaceae bacterium]
MTALASGVSRRWRVRDIVLLAPKIVLTALLALAIGDMIFGVFMRYVVTAITDRLDVDPFNFFFVEEVGEYTLAWLTMIGAGIGIADRAHFTLHVLTHRFPLAAQRVIHVATHLLIAAFGALAVWYGVQLAIVNSQLTSPALEINLAWLYAAPAVGGALIILYGIAAIFEKPPPDEADETGIAAAGDD